MAGRLGRAIKNMERQRAANRPKAKGLNPLKTCPGCGMNIKDMTLEQKANHTDRCL